MNFGQRHMNCGFQPSRMKKISVSVCDVCCAGLTRVTKLCGLAIRRFKFEWGNVRLDWNQLTNRPHLEEDLLLDWTPIPEDEFDHRCAIPVVANTEGGGAIWDRVLWLALEEGFWSWILPVGWNDEIGYIMAYMDSGERVDQETIDAWDFATSSNIRIAAYPENLKMQE